MSGLNIRHDGSTLTLDIDRPQHANALTLALLTEMRDAINRAEKDPTIRLIVVRSAGRVFSAGGDISEEELAKNRPLDSEAGSVVHLMANELALTMLSSGTPVLTVVQGAAAGVACSIVLASDYIVATSKARFLMPFTRIGLVPDGGATGLLANELTHARAAEIALFGGKIEAEKALSWGIVNEIVSEDAVDERVTEISQTVAAASPGATAKAKQLITASRIQALTTVLPLEVQAQVDLVTSGEFDRYRPHR